MFAADGIGKAVLHVNGGKELTDEKRYDCWVRYVRKLSEYVNGTGVTLCIENMYTIPQCRTVDQIKSIIKDAGSNSVADTHQMPFSARYGVDWKEVMTAMKYASCALSATCQLYDEHSCFLL